MWGVCKVQGESGSGFSPSSALGASGIYIEQPKCQNEIYFELIILLKLIKTVEPLKVGTNVNKT